MCTSSWSLQCSNYLVFTTLSIWLIVERTVWFTDLFIRKFHIHQCMRSLACAFCLLRRIAATWWPNSSSSSFLCTRLSSIHLKLLMIISSTSSPRWFYASSLEVAKAQTRGCINLSNTGRSTYWPFRDGWGDWWSVNSLLQIIEQWKYSLNIHV